MTFEPPPPGSPPSPPPSEGSQWQWSPPPPNYGSPAQGSQYWSPPPGAPYGSPRRPFDAGTVNPLDWAILGTGLLAFLFSFLTYYTYSDKDPTCTGICEVSNNAWHGFFGWFAALLAVLGAAAVAAELWGRDFRVGLPNRLAGLAAFALATLSVILALFVVPTGYVFGFAIPDSQANKGHGFGFWVSLIVIVAGFVLSFLRFQQTGGQLPGRMAGRATGSGQSGPGGPGSPTGPGGYRPPGPEGYNQSGPGGYGPSGPGGKGPSGPEGYPPTGPAGYGPPQ
jgi:hypothetical protein